MGRELRRKQAKKEGKSLEREELIEKNPIRKLIIITCVLITLIAIIYLVTALFITKELKWFNKDEKNSSETENISNSILASSTFKQSEESYYVYFYNFNEEKNAITETLNSKWANKKYYRVDTSSAMNANYVGEKGNRAAKNISELKVIPSTLIEISNQKIVAYYEGNEIINLLQLED